MRAAILDFLRRMFCFHRFVFDERVIEFTDGLAVRRRRCMDCGQTNLEYTAGRR